MDFNVLLLRSMLVATIVVNWLPKETTQSYSNPAHFARLISVTYTILPANQVTNWLNSKIAEKNAR